MSPTVTWHHAPGALHAEVVVAAWSTHQWAWCLAMQGEGRRWQATHVDDGGYMQGVSSRRIWGINYPQVV